MDIWNEIEGIIKNSNKKVSVFEGSPEIGSSECNELHIPSDSVLGSIVMHSTGIVIDNWIRIFGQDSSLNNGVSHYNRTNDYMDELEGCFLWQAMCPEVCMQ